MTTKHIEVTIKNVFGNEKIYPACPDAEIFCKLIGQKTLTERDINLIKQLGYTVNVTAAHPQTL